MGHSETVPAAGPAAEVGPADDPSSCSCTDGGRTDDGCTDGGRTDGGCTDVACTRGRYARAVADAGGTAVDGHTLAATERAISRRISGLQIDMAAMAAVQNLYRAANAVRNHLEQTVLAPHQLTWTGWVVLWVIWIWEEIESRHVAVEAGISKGTLTGVVKTLESRGLVLRQTHPEDARRVLLRLTPAGTQLMAVLFPQFNEQESALTGSLGEASRLQLAQLLRMVVADLEG